MNFNSPKAPAKQQPVYSNRFTYESPRAPMKAGSPVNKGFAASAQSFLDGPFQASGKYAQSPANFGLGLMNQDTALATPPTRKESKVNGSTGYEHQAGKLKSFDEQLTPQKSSDTFNELMTPPRHSKQDMSDDEVDKHLRAPTKGMYRDFIEQPMRQVSPGRPRCLFDAGIKAFKVHDEPASSFLFDIDEADNMSLRQTANSSNENQPDRSQLLNTAIANARIEAKPSQNSNNFGALNWVTSDSNTAARHFR